MVSIYFMVCTTWHTIKHVKRCCIVLSAFCFQVSTHFVFHLPDTVPNSSRNCLHLPLLFLAFPFLTDPLKTWACERAPHTSRLVSPDVRPGPQSLIGIGWIIVRISFFHLHELFFLCVSGCWHLFMLPRTSESQLLKSVWNTCPEMPLSSVNPRMTWSLPVSVTPTGLSSPPLWPELSLQRHFVTYLSLGHFTWGPRIQINNSGWKQFICPWAV